MYIIFMHQFCCFYQKISSVNIESLLPVMMLKAVDYHYTQVSLPIIFLLSIVEYLMDYFETACNDITYLTN